MAQVTSLNWKLFAAVIFAASLLLLILSGPSRASGSASDSVLYGVTGDGSSTLPETLLIIDISDPSVTNVTHLVNGGSGEEIAYNPDTGLILHASDADVVGPGRGRILENIDPLTTVITPVSASGFSYFEVTGLTYEGSGNFFAGDVEDVLLRISSTGVVSQIGEIDHGATGLAFVGGTLYSVSRDSNLWIVDAATGATTGSLTITIAGNPISSATALAADPATGQLFAVLKTGSSRSLATIDPTTGIATIVGNFGNLRFAGLAFVGSSADSTPPVIHDVSADHSETGTPNHKMVSITVDVDATDDSGEAPSCIITGISDDESNDAADSEITGDLDAKVRAERDGNGDGRTYTIVVTCTDAAGNPVDVSVDVNVAHDQGDGEGRYR